MSKLYLVDILTSYFDKGSYSPPLKGDIQPAKTRQTLTSDANGLEMGTLCQVIAYFSGVGSVRKPEINHLKR